MEDKSRKFKFHKVLCMINRPSRLQVLAVTFVASTAFMILVGYQTNLFVCGPGGYTFSGFLRIGALSQFLLSSITVRGIAFFWGVRV